MIGLAFNILYVNCMEGVYMAVKSFSDHQSGRNRPGSEKGRHNTI